MKKSLSTLAKTIIAIIRSRSKPLNIGSMAHMLEQRKAIEPYNDGWEVNGRQEAAWWRQVYDAVREAVGTGIVGVHGKDDNVLFLAVRVRTDRPCGSPDCATSTGIHDETTYGSGELDSNGFWEVPCPICERSYRGTHAD